jgi:long-chain acyl-CoA synthetase
VPGVDVRIAEDGQILVRGPNVFRGYFKDPEATAQALVDGWLQSGDLGRIDEDGFLHITGRIKEIIITAGGKNIAPKNIEGALKQHPGIAEAVIIGDRRKYLSALIWLDPELAWPSRDEVQRIVDQVNLRFARVEHVRRFTLLKTPLSVDAGELTPTLKVKRQAVAARYAAEIERMYEGA